MDLDAQRVGSTPTLVPRSRNDCFLSFQPQGGLSGRADFADVRKTDIDGTMNRRTLLGLAASLSTLASTPTFACSPVFRSARSSGLENQQVRMVFQAWWERDAPKFRSYFTDTLMDDGTPMEPELARDLHAQNPIPEHAFSIFDEFFTDTSKRCRIALILNTAAGMIVACSESDRSPEIQPDCTGMPKLHLFLVTMEGLNPRAIAHLATTDTVDADKISIWTEGAAGDFSH